jgi:hypothetical protein
MPRIVSSGTITIKAIIIFCIIGGLWSSAFADDLLHYYFPPEENLNQTITTQVCIYGGTSAGVVAALELSRLGIDSVIVHPGIRLGGLSAGGLGYTDFGNKDAVQGLSREFYQRVGAKYAQTENWAFEPSVALEVFQDMVQEAEVDVYYKAFLDRSGGTVMSNGRIVRITTENGLTVNADYFIDATYEADLMAAAGVTYTTGRESNAAYNETYNGQQVRGGHQFDANVSPYVIEGNPGSGLLAGIETITPVTGTGDHRVQAYNFRICMTDAAANRIAFPKPANYDRTWYVLLERYLRAGFGTDFGSFFQKFDRIINGKTDTNNHGAVSTDFIGQNYHWPDGNYATREQIFQNHVTYIQGYWWFVTHDPAVGQAAPAIQSQIQNWGLAADEFTETGNWPSQLYVREARRMVSDYVITQHDFFGKTQVLDSIGLASYNMDSHNCTRFVNSSGYVKNEGDVQTGGITPYSLSYRAVIPRTGECANLAVPVCVSASHIAYGSVRMEPIFMILGQSSAVAIAQAVGSGNVALQSIHIPTLKKMLVQRGQRIYWGTDPVLLEEGMVVDTEDTSGVIETGTWTESSSTPGYNGLSYLHDGDSEKDGKSVQFNLNVPSSGTYEVYLRWTSHENRASNVPVTVTHDGGQANHTVDQRTGGGQWNLLGNYPFSEGAGAIVVSNADTNGYVIADAVFFLNPIDSCSDVLAAGHRIMADISGPTGQPDCYVDMYDLAELASQWLLNLDNQ